MYLDAKEFISGAKKDTGIHRHPPSTVCTLCSQADSTTFVLDLDHMIDVSSME